MTSPASARDALDVHLASRGVDPATDVDMQRFDQQIAIAESLYAARVAAGLTLAQVADMIGTTEEVVSALEAADYEGDSMAVLQRIAHALGKHVEIRLVPGTRAAVAQ